MRRVVDVLVELFDILPARPCLVDTLPGRVVVLLRDDRLFRCLLRKAILWQVLKEKSHGSAGFLLVAESTFDRSEGGPGQTTRSSPERLALILQDPSRHPGGCSRHRHPVPDSFPIWLDFVDSTSRLVHGHLRVQSRGLHRRADPPMPLMVIKLHPLIRRRWECPSQALVISCTTFMIIRGDSPVSSI